MRDATKSIDVEEESSVTNEPVGSDIEQKIVSSDEAYLAYLPPLTPEEETRLNVKKLPPELFQALLPFQKEGVKFIVSKNGRGLIADEMGLGKLV